MEGQQKVPWAGQRRVVSLPAPPTSLIISYFHLIRSPGVYKCPKKAYEKAQLGVTSTYFRSECFKGVTELKTFPHLKTNTKKYLIFSCCLSPETTP